MTGRPTPFLSAFAVLALAACGEAKPICQNTVIREAVSPGGDLKAVLFHRACGDLAGEASQISVLAANQTETGKGNAFIVDAASGAAPIGAWGGPDVLMEWSAPLALTLSYHDRSRIIAYEPVVRGVTISHRSTD
jgi:hypothetical protein